MRKLTLPDTFRFGRFSKIIHMHELLPEIFAEVSAAKEVRMRKIRDLTDAVNAVEAGEKWDYIRSMRQTALEDAQNDDSWLAELGASIFSQILEAASETGAEAALYKFLAPVWECSVDDFASITMEEVVKNVQAMFAENDMRTFFSSALRMGK